MTHMLTGILNVQGTWTQETIVKMEEWTLDNVRQAVQRGTLKSPVPEQVDL